MTGQQPTTPPEERVNGRVSGKVVLITGAARGQGRSHAVHLAKEGADLLLIDVADPIAHLAYPTATADDLAETIRLVTEAGGRAHGATVDVRHADGLAEAVSDGVAALGRLDVVVANAGVVTTQRWHEVTPDLWDTVVGINLTGVWNTCQATLPHVLASGGGSLILVSSIAGLKGQPFLTPYAAAKHGVVGIMRSLAGELASQSVRVNSLHPTGVASPMLAGMAPLTSFVAEDPTTGPLFENLLPVSVIGAGDVSAAVVYLASDESRHVTGTTFTVDAGATAR